MSKNGIGFVPHPLVWPDAKAEGVLITWDIVTGRRGTRIGFFRWIPGNGVVAKRPEMGLGSFGKMVYDGLPGSELARPRIDSAAPFICSVRFFSAFLDIISPLPFVSFPLDCIGGGDATSNRFNYLLQGLKIG